MAKGIARKKGTAGRKGPLIALALVGFVLLAIGVNLRRVYGLRQAREMREMQQRREALISEQLKLQDEIRVASDRKHIIDIAQTRLGMKLPDLNQVIDLPRRPLVRDSVRR
jgi:cell division protein FtsL